MDKINAIIIVENIHIHIYVHKFVFICLNNKIFIKTSRKIHKLNNVLIYSCNIIITKKIYTYTFVAGLNVNKNCKI